MYVEIGLKFLERKGKMLKFIYEWMDRFFIVGYMQFI